MKTRALNPIFLKKFSTDNELKKILTIVKNDNDLMMCLRGDYVSIYYKSLQILKIDENIKFYIDANYKVNPENYNGCWEKYFEEAKSALDNYGEAEKLEKEVQQLIAKENNCGRKSCETDYYIFDIEYAQGEYDGGRFDAMAVCWPSGNSRSSGKDLQLALIEIKYAEGAISGECGVSDHYRSVTKFLDAINNNGEEKELFYNDIEEVIRQLKKLGLLVVLTADGKTKNEHEITISRTQKPQLIFALANYSTNATCLDTELNEIEKYNREYEKENRQIPFELLFATSPFIGYGLYKKCMLNKNEVLEMLLKKGKTKCQN